MNTEDRFDELIRERLRADAPREAPARILEGAMTRISDTPQGRRGWFGGIAGRLLVAAAVLLVAVVAGTQLAALIDRPSGTGESPSPTVMPSGSPPDSPTPSDTSAPSPSAEPTASPGAADELVLRVIAFGGGPTSPSVLVPWASVMADGTLIWQPAPEGPEQPGLVARRLTPAGLEELRQRIFGDGLLDESASHELERRPGAPEPPGRGIGSFEFTAGQGEDAVVVTSVEWLGEEEESTYYEPSPEREALDALARALRDPESMLAGDAWAGPAGAYEGDEYLLVMMPMRDVPPFGVVDISDVPIPFNGPIDEYGEAAGDPRGLLTRCGVVSHDEAESIIAALLEQGSGGMSTFTGASLDWAEGNGVVDVGVLPRMPDGYPGCGDA